MSGENKIGLYVEINYLFLDSAGKDQFLFYYFSVHRMDMIKMHLITIILNK